MSSTFHSFFRHRFRFASTVGLLRSWHRNDSSFPRHAVSLCAAASMVDWINRNEEQFHIPTLQEINDAKDKHAHGGKSDDEDNNLRFFQDYDTMIAEFTAKLEDESQREILHYKQQIVNSIAGANKLRDCIVVEVGSGSGVFIPEIAHAVGENGSYIGLDISPAFVYYASRKFSDLSNVKLSLSEADDLKLPSELKGKVDAFFLCATYHHLSDVTAILRQIYDYLKPGGKLVIVEFKKHDHHHHHHHHQHHHGEKGKINHQQCIDEALSKTKPGKQKLDTEWIRNHIPFTEKQAKEEIVSHGFRFDQNVMAEHWESHFVHVYSKPSFF